MKRKIMKLQIAALVVMMSFMTQSQLQAKAYLIPVDSIFANLSSMFEIRVIGYIGDTSMVYIHLSTQDTLEMECKLKKLNEITNIRIKARNPSYDGWAGSFPNIDDTVSVMKYSYYGMRTLLAKKLNGKYRFWEPFPVPFADSVFLIKSGGVYEPTAGCQGGHWDEESIRCPFGFLIEEKDFEWIRAKNGQ